MYCRVYCKRMQVLCVDICTRLHQATGTGGVVTGLRMLQRRKGLRVRVEAAVVQARTRFDFAQLGRRR